MDTGLYRAILRAVTLILIILPSASAAADVGERDSLVVSLLTCAPGREVYELCGHSALRIRSAGAGPQAMDSVWNYGLFDFSEPHFVYRFVKGETDYMVGGYPFAMFLPEYRAQGRRVTEQELNLTDGEARRLLGMLRQESLPQNRVYRYNYVKDNCATRITRRLGEAAGQRIIFPDTAVYGTFRDEMRAFHRNYPWYQFGIDLALGSGLDYRLRPDEEMFVPVVMSERYGGARLADGRPLVRMTRELLPDSGTATLGPSSWYATPLCCFTALLAAVLLACWWMLWKRRVLRWVFAVWFAAIGLTGCVTAFLVFASSHEATSPNILILWLNPLQLLMAAGVWSRRTRWMSRGMAWYDITVLVIMLIVWPFQRQSANPAFFPLMASTLALTITYAILAASDSYNKDSDQPKSRDKHAEVSSRGTGGTRRTDGGVRTGRGKAPARGGHRR